MVRKGNQDEALQNSPPVLPPLRKENIRQGKQVPNESIGYGENQIADIEKGKIKV